MGYLMGEIVMDERGRIVIPKEIRRTLRRRPNQKLAIEAHAGEIVIKPTIDVEEFKAQLKGCISGSQIKPSELKKIWGVKM
jgi:AbrB family looped-hinge helix DNA binding protein